MAFDLAYMMAPLLLRSERNRPQTLPPPPLLALSALAERGGSTRLRPSGQGCLGPRRRSLPGIQGRRGPGGPGCSGTLRPSSGPGPARRSGVCVAGEELGGGRSGLQGQGQVRWARMNQAGRRGIGPFWLPHAAPACAGSQRPS
ncbi:collagen alpha-1(I) chain-like [Symphalangus syndactylus]|uniref:collagen alpha-1(I) chain-like n=1 Tax=Symphalangus syndactylus TaxID=9590 RepID=UPI002441EA44|nr:collagen alpha-1(I) chain-like [Symphalangus syndactylus]